MGTNENRDGIPASACFGRASAAALAALLILAPVSAPLAAVAPHAVGTASLPDPDSLACRIADRYGAAEFYKINSIHFVFNVHFKDKVMAREWTWFPKADSVIYKGPDAKGLHISAAYSRKNTYSMGSEPVGSIDKSFINDQYWLLFPLHLRWDKGLSFRVAPAVKPGEAYQLTATYSSAGGYTPGDAYDLFVDSSGMMKRWIYRKANSAQPTREAMWSEPKGFSGVGISMEHPGTDPGFKLWFSDVKVAAGPT